MQFIIYLNSLQCAELHTHASTHSLIHAHAHTHTHARTHARTHACTHTRTHACTHTRTHACTHTRAHARTHACTHARMHARTHARTHTHTHTYTHTHYIPSQGRPNAKIQHWLFTDAALTTGRASELRRHRRLPGCGRRRWRWRQRRKCSDPSQQHDGTRPRHSQRRESWQM